MPKPANTVSNLDQSKVGLRTTTTYRPIKKVFGAFQKTREDEITPIIPDLPEKAKKKQRA